MMAITVEPKNLTLRRWKTFRCLTTATGEGSTSAWPLGCVGPTWTSSRVSTAGPLPARLASQIYFFGYLVLSGPVSFTGSSNSLICCSGKIFFSRMISRIPLLVL